MSLATPCRLRAEEIKVTQVLEGWQGSEQRLVARHFDHEVQIGSVATARSCRVATRRARDGVPTGGRHSVPYRVACEDLKPFNLEASRRVLPAFRYVKPNRLGHLSLR